MEADHRMFTLNLWAMYIVVNTNSDLGQVFCQISER